MPIVKEQFRSGVLSLVDEQLRRGSAKATQTIARRFGDSLGMWVGCGYPKSGTVWLCQLLSSYLDLPHPRRFRTPIAMPSVVHAHWMPDSRLPRTVYIVRDGRDVMVSRYFYEVRLASSDLNPNAARRRRERFTRVLGAGADLNDIKSNLPKFIQAELESPSWMQASWGAHVEAWLDAPQEKVSIVRYEDLLISVEDTLGPAIEHLTGEPADRSYLRIAGERFQFAQQVRLAGRHQERQGPVLRKGISGDWKNYFNQDARAIFSESEGRALKRLGYETS